MGCLFYYIAKKIFGIQLELFCAQKIELNQNVCTGCSICKNQQENLYLLEF